MVLLGYLLLLKPSLPPVPLEAGEEPPEAPGAAPLPQGTFSTNTDLRPYGTTAHRSDLRTTPPGLLLAP